MTYKLVASGRLEIGLNVQPIQWIINNTRDTPYKAARDVASTSHALIADEAPPLSQLTPHLLDSPT